MLVCLLSTSKKFFSRRIDPFYRWLLPDFASFLCSNVLILVSVRPEGFMAPWAADRKEVTSVEVFPGTFSNAERIVARDGLLDTMYSAPTWPGA